MCNACRISELMKVNEPTKIKTNLPEKYFYVAEVITHSKAPAKIKNMMKKDINRLRAILKIRWIILNLLNNSNKLQNMSP